MGRKRTKGRGRAERLLELIQALRRRRRPVTARELADELGVSPRSLYRDIVSLRAQGAGIEGEAGVGYVLKAGFLLPPLMFAEEEIEALVLGMRWVADRADAELGKAARDAMAKIAAVLPADLRDSADASALLVAPGEPLVSGGADLAPIRRAIRAERRLAIVYKDAGGKPTKRTIWPFALGFFDRARVVVAWCELRQGFRHFRTDRIAELGEAGGRYPRRRATLLKEWRAAEGIGE